MTARDGGHIAETRYLKIREQIAGRILPPGSKLPSLRDFAIEHGISKNTAVAVYERLVEEGLVEPRHGSGYFVTGDISRPNPVLESSRPAIDYALSELGILPGRKEAGALLPSIGEGLPPSSWIEDYRLDKYMQKVGRGGLGGVFRYGDAYGYLPLRRHIAQRIDAYGISATPEQVILSNGSFQAIDLVVRTFVKNGETVLVDEPGFYPTFNKLRLQGARIVGVPRLRDGPDVDFVESAQRRYSARFFFTQSVAHNPTGTDISKPVAERLREVCRTSGLVVVDDDALADYKPADHVRISALDGLEHSIYIGSFSKSLPSHVRVGFIACRLDRVEPLVRIKVMTALNSSQFAERMVEAIMQEGRFLKHAQALQKKARDATSQSLQFLADIGADVFHVPAQSLYLWVRLPVVHDAVDLSRFFHARRLAFAPGGLFHLAGHAPCPWFRWNTGYMNDQTRSVLLDFLSAVRH